MKTVLAIACLEFIMAVLAGLTSGPQYKRDRDGKPFSWGVAFFSLHVFLGLFVAFGYIIYFIYGAL